MLYPEIQKQSDGVYEVKVLKNGQQSVKKIANYIAVKRQILNIDTKKELIELEFQRINQVGLSKLEVSVEDLTSSRAIANLSRYGMDVNDLNCRGIVKHIRNEREMAPRENCHESLGFKLEGNQLTFYHYAVHGSSEESAYIGGLNIQPKGSKDKYLDMLNNEVIGNPQLELALVLGFSSAMTSLLQLKYDISNPFFHMVGDSSSGKTTSMCLGCSVWGEPRLSTKGLVNSYDTTLNALQKKIALSNGVLFALDELSTYTDPDITKLIYSLAQGKMRGRMNKNAELNEELEWNTTILSTGERSLLDMAKGNTGLRVRVYDFEFSQWTTSAENSENIKKIIGENYGLLGVDFVQQLIALGLTSVCTRYDECKNRVANKLETGKFDKRIAGQIAVLFTTAQIVKEYLSIPLNLETMEDLVIQTINKELERIDIGEVALDRFITYLATNRSKFSTESKSKYYRNEQAHITDCQGKVLCNAQQEDEEVAIPIDKFKDIMSELKFQSYKIVIKSWKAKNWLNVEKDRSSRRMPINGVADVSCYVLKLKEAKKSMNC